MPGIAAGGSEQVFSFARRRGVEILDDPNVDSAILTRAMEDVERANRILGGLDAALSEMGETVGDLPECARLLDVGTGTADIPAGARKLAADNGITLTTIGFDISPVLLERNRNRNDSVVLGDALALPFRDSSVDVVTCSQVLHHFQDADAKRLITEMNRVARRRVVISDIRRSVFAAGGLWLASFVLRFHPVSRHDGVVSVMRGFVSRELSDLVASAIGQKPVVKYRRGFRVTTSWKPLRA
jgi:ubiquinone/menaquinone biosynthesis C-methylase UbiE